MTIRSADRPGPGVPVVDAGPFGDGATDAPMSLRDALVDPRLFDELARFAVFVVGDRDDAEEVCAEVIARTWARSDRYSVSDARSFLLRAITNEAVSRGRRRQRLGRLLPRLAPVGLQASPEGGVADRHRLGVALATLRPLERAVVVARYVNDLSEDDTATLLGVPLGTVKSASSRARDRLRILLEDRDV